MSLEIEQNPTITDLLLKRARELHIVETTEMEKLRRLFAIAEDAELAMLAGRYQDIAQQVADQSTDPTFTQTLLVSILYSSQRAPLLLREALDDSVTVLVNEGREKFADQMLTIQALL